jgi:hypothetical protein
MAAASATSPATMVHLAIVASHGPDGRLDPNAAAGSRTVPPMGPKVACGDGTGVRLGVDGTGEFVTVGVEVGGGAGSSITVTVWFSGLAT